MLHARQLWESLFIQASQVAETANWTGSDLAGLQAARLLLRRQRFCKQKHPREMHSALRCRDSHLHILKLRKKEQKLFECEKTVSLIFK